MKKLFSASILTAAMLCSAADNTWWQKPYVPADCPVPTQEKPLQKKEDVKIIIPKLGEFAAGAFVERKNLAGNWKFSGLETSELPFPSECPAAERNQLMPQFDDSAWKTIPVPANWWTVPGYKYEQVFRPSKKTNVKSQAYNKRTSNPYCKGIYRQIIDLGSRISGSVILEFHAIGYEAELYVNGKLAGRHHGDFHTWKVNITDFAKPGKNLIALRVLADLGPHDEVYTHVYGAAWTNNCIKGGLWDHVWLNLDKSAYEINSMKIAADSKGDLELHYNILYKGDTPVTLTPGLAVNIAQQDIAPARAIEFPAVTLKKGSNKGVLKQTYQNVKTWSPDTPELYFCTLYFRDNAKVRAARVERFGFRDFKIQGSRFLLNGKDIYLSLETAQSMIFSGNAGDVRNRIKIFRVKGVNMLRTAHQPVTPRLIEAADEMGMMIYGEWALGSFRNIVPELFLKRDLKELESFINRDHNNPSVVMWLLGNEVEHRTNKHIHKLLNDQYDLVRSIDVQKRPIANFAGCGNLHHYGYGKLKTDVIDYHLYTGITRPALRWEEDFSRYVKMTAQVYGKNGKLTMPIVISEAIGGGWGHQPDAKYKHGNIDQYLEIINRSFYWGNPGPAGYSGAIGIRSAIDPKRQWMYINNINGTRVVEMARQDDRIAGFGTWIGHPMAQSSRWTQSIYPGLRTAPDKKFPIHQYFAPGKTKVNFFLLNQGQTDLTDGTCRIEIARDGNIVPVREIVIGPLPSGKNMSKYIDLDLPELSPGRWELRLTILDGGKETNFRNSYYVEIHDPAIAAKPIANAKKVLLMAKHPGTEKILNDLAIPYDIAKGNDNLSAYDVLVIPPQVNAAKLPGKQISAYAETGGRVLILEQDPGTLPGFTSYTVSADENTMVEPVVTAHPIFKDLVQADFDIWAQNPGAKVIANVITPLDATALAVKGRFLDEKGAGNAVAEIKFGKGRVVLSQLLAVNLWKVNASATRFLRNLFAYVCAASDAELWKDARSAAAMTQLVFPIAHERIHKIDLRRFANNSFADDKEGDGVGWTDQGPQSDLRNIPAGSQEVAGVPFDIIDAKTNNGKDCISLKGGKLKMPEKVSNIPVGKKVENITFLHTAGFGGGSGIQAVYTIKYADNTQVRYPVVSGINGGDWWNPDAKSAAAVGLIRKNGLGVNCGLYAARWVNPYPEKLVKSFDYSIGDGGMFMPVLAAATAELVHAEPLTLVNNATARWGCTADRKGNPGTAVIMKDEARPYSRVKMMASTPNGGYSASIVWLFPDPKKFENNTYDYITFCYRSNDSGKIDLVIPRVDHRARLIHSFELQNSGGKWIRARLNLKMDFTLVGAEFDIHSMRKELIFYNGFNKKAGFPRNEVTFDIRDIRLE